MKKLKRISDKINEEYIEKRKYYYYLNFKMINKKLKIKIFRNKQKKINMKIKVFIKIMMFNCNYKIYLQDQINRKS